MNEIIKIEINANNEQTVSARDPHEALGINIDFTDWFKYQAEKMNLRAGKDFTTILGKSAGGRPSQDFVVALDDETIKMS